MTTSAQNPSQEPRKRRGRPPAAADQRRRPGSIRLDEARWAKLRRLGSAWLERAIDRARIG